LKIKVFYSHVQTYGTLNEAKLQQFADIAWLYCYQWLKKYYITLTRSLSFVTFWYFQMIWP